MEGFRELTASACDSIIFLFRLQVWDGAFKYASHEHNHMREDHTLNK